MSEFKKLDISNHESAEVNIVDNFWKGLAVGSTPIQLDGTINDISYCPVAPYHHAVTSNYEVLLMSSRTDSQLRRIPVKTRAAVLTALSWRGDGSLLAAGDEMGQVRLFDTHSRAQLRLFHSDADAAVTCTAFTCDKKLTASSAQDGSLSLWDVTQEDKPLMKIQVSERDQLRGLDVSSTSPWLLASGSYDGYARLHDTRCPEDNNHLVELRHGFPVESVLLSTDDGLLFTAGECWVRVWSLGQRKQVAAFRRHHKAVTRLALACQGSRLLTAGLDGLLKVTDCLSFEEVHHYEYHHAQILSMALAADHSSLAVGTVDRWLHRRRRASPEELAAAATTSAAAKRQQRLMDIGVMEKKPRVEDVVRPHVPRENKLEKYEKMLRAFRHSDALSAVLQPHTLRLQPDTVCAVLRALQHRNALRVALAGRPDQEVIRLLRFVHKNLLVSDRCELLLVVADHLLRLYSHIDAVKDDLRRLCGLLRAETEFTQLAETALGQIDLLLGEVSAFPYENEAR